MAQRPATEGSEVERWVGPYVGIIAHGCSPLPSRTPELVFVARVEYFRCRYFAAEWLRATVLA